MNPRRLPLGALIFSMLLCGNRGGAQRLSVSGATDPDLAPNVKLSILRPAVPRTFPPFTKVGFDIHAGLGGLEFDVATNLSRTLNLRAGADFFGYSTTFQDQGANVAINLRMRSGHAGLDSFFPIFSADFGYSF